MSVKKILYAGIFCLRNKNQAHYYDTSSEQIARKSLNQLCSVILSNRGRGVHNGGLHIFEIFYPPP